jgi:hypothetical protein
MSALAAMVARLESEKDNVIGQLFCSPECENTFFVGVQERNIWVIWISNATTPERNPPLQRRHILNSNLHCQTLRVTLSLPTVHWL